MHTVLRVISCVTVVYKMIFFNFFSNGPEEVVPAEILQEPLLVMKSCGVLCGAVLPNHYERD